MGPTPKSNDKQAKEENKNKRERNQASQSQHTPPPHPSCPNNVPPHPIYYHLLQPLSPRVPSPPSPPPPPPPTNFLYPPPLPPSQNPSLSPQNLTLCLHHPNSKLFLTDSSVLGGGKRGFLGVLVWGSDLGFGIPD